MAYRIFPALRPLLQRGVALSALARLVVAVTAGVASASSSGKLGAATLRLAPVTMLAFTGLCGVLMLLDTARRREVVLFANLGIGVGTIVLCAVLPAIALEAVIVLMASL